MIRSVSLGFFSFNFETKLHAITIHDDSSLMKFKCNECDVIIEYRIPRTICKYHIMQSSYGGKVLITTTNSAR